MTPLDKKPWAIAQAFEGTIDVKDEKYWVSAHYVQVADDQQSVSSWVVQITYECCMIEMPLAVFLVWREMLIKSKVPPTTG